MLLSLCLIPLLISLSQSEQCALLANPNVTQSATVSTNNNAAGTQFDIEVSSQAPCIVIKRLATKLPCSGRQVAVFMSPTLGGVATTNGVSGFQRIGSAVTVATGSTSVLTWVPLTLNVTMKPGERRSFAILTDNTCVHYQNTVALDTTTAQDAFIHVRGGRGVSSSHSVTSTVLASGGIFNNRLGRIGVEYSTGILITNSPSATPTSVPSSSPSSLPSIAPTQVPSALPSASPSVVPSSAPTRVPSQSPSQVPSSGPSSSPTVIPSKAPSQIPSTSPSGSPTLSPSQTPSTLPSTTPSLAPSLMPSKAPSSPPSDSPTAIPSIAPSQAPSQAPTLSPSRHPSQQPSSSSPSHTPTSGPTRVPLRSPTKSPTIFSINAAGSGTSVTMAGELSSGGLLAIIIVSCILAVACLVGIVYYVRMVKAPPLLEQTKTPPPQIVRAESTQSELEGEGVRSEQGSDGAKAKPWFLVRRIV